MWRIVFTNRISGDSYKDTPLPILRLITLVLLYSEYPGFHNKVYVKKNKWWEKQNSSIWDLDELKCLLNQDGVKERDRFRFSCFWFETLDRFVRYTVYPSRFTFHLSPPCSGTTRPTFTNFISGLFFPPSFLFTLANGSHNGKRFGRGRLKLRYLLLWLSPCQGTDDLFLSFSTEVHSYYSAVLSCNYSTSFGPPYIS